MDPDRARLYRVRVIKEMMNPFGLSFNSYTRPAITAQNFKFNAGSELESMTDWYSTPFRKYDPSLGRFHGVDALADLYSSMTPSHFAGNNPIMYNDPTGLHQDDPDGEVSAPGNSGNGKGWGYRESIFTNYWSNGIGNGDWSLAEGSQQYRNERAYSEATNGYSLGNTFYTGDGNEITTNANGEIGYWEEEDGGEYAGTTKMVIDGKEYDNVFVNDVTNTLKFVTKISQVGLWGQLMARVNQDIMIMTDGQGGPDIALRKSDGSPARLLNISEVLPAGTTRSAKRSTGNTKMENVYEGTSVLMEATVEFFGINWATPSDTIQESLFTKYIISQDSVIDEVMKRKYKKGDNPFMKYRDVD